MSESVSLSEYLGELAREMEMVYYNFTDEEVVRAIFGQWAERLHERGIDAETFAREGFRFLFKDELKE